MPQGTLGTLSQGRDNNLTLLRFIAASLVIVTHAFGITGNGGDEPLIQLCSLSMGSYAVDIFFVVSGFLIAKSWYRRQDLVEYLYARFLRIYPALWLAVGLCVLVVGPVFTRLSLADYFSHFDTFKFLVKNATLLPTGVVTDLPGVFESHPIAGVNLPLWTLPYELKMYLLLALFSILGLTTHRAFLPPLVLAALIAFAIGVLKLDPVLVKHLELSRFIYFFFAGVLFYVYRNAILIHWQIAALIAVATLMVFCLPVTHGYKRLFLALATPYLVIYLAFAPAGPIRQFNRLGDYSYGIYIYGFPIQQMVFSLSGSSSVSLNALVSWALCLILAAASWHWLEKRALAAPMPGWLLRIRSWMPAFLVRSRS